MLKKNDKLNAFVAVSIQVINLSSDTIAFWSSEDYNVIVDLRPNSQSLQMYPKRSAEGNPSGGFGCASGRLYIGKRLAPGNPFSQVALVGYNVAINSPDMDINLIYSWDGTNLARISK